MVLVERDETAREPQTREAKRECAIVGDAEVAGEEGRKAADDVKEAATDAA